jgi:hypothetical protein
MSRDAAPGDGDGRSGVDGRDADRGDSGSPIPRPALLALVALLGALAWLIRPWLHSLVYALYTTPLLVVPLVLAAVAGWYAYETERNPPVDEFTVRGRTGQQFSPLRVGVVVLLLAGLVVSPVAQAVAGETMSDQTLAETERVAALDDVDAENPRIVTRAVAERYASNTLNRPQYRTADIDITVVDGTPYWAAPLAPDGLFNLLTKRQGGTVLVDMTTQQSNVRTVDGAMEEGVGTLFVRNYRWHLLKNGEYLVDYGDPRMVVHEGAQYIVVPYATPTFHLAPIPHSTPTWGGVALVDAEGSIEMLSPAEARSHPVLEGQQLYPERLARQKVAATKYRNGIVNTFTSHEDEIEVAPVPGARNEQPFFVLSEDGPQYVVAVEPYGDAQGLREVWTVDGRTGAFEVYRPEESLFGPQKAADLVRQSSPQTDWNRFSPAEPILTVVEDQEYWQVRVVPVDNSGIAYVAFVNAQTSDVTEFERTDAIERFLAGESPTNRTRADESGDGTTGAEPTVIVQRVAENGSVVETMRIYANESVRIQSAETGTPGAPTAGTPRETNGTAQTNETTTGRVATPRP